MRPYFCLLALPLLAQAPYERIRRAELERGQWLTHSGNYSAHRYSPLAQINTANVAQLKVKWMYQLNRTARFETTPLVADGATVSILGAAGERSMPLEDFFTGPGRTRLAAGEIVTGFAVPPPPPGTGKCYIKHGRRKAMELATVGVAVSITVAAGRCSAIRIALGAVAPTPIRARKAEAVLAGQPVSEELIARCAATAASETSPISNIRGSADYRRRMVEELTRRAIRSAMEAAR